MLPLGSKVITAKKQKELMYGKIANEQITCAPHLDGIDTILRHDSAVSIPEIEQLTHR